MALILCVETATTLCSAALFSDGKLIASKEIDAGYSHAENLAFFVQELINENLDGNAKQIDALALSAGPGSYTGLRIGAAFAKGFCYALQIPLMAISTLKLIAANAKLSYPDAAIFIPMIDAKRDEVYLGVYSNLLETRVADYNLIVTPDSFQEYKGIDKVVFCGSGAEKTSGFCAAKNFVFEPTISLNINCWGNIIEEAFEQKEFADVAYFEPFYIKAVYTTTPNPAKKLL